MLRGRALSTLCESSSYLALLPRRVQAPPQLKVSGRSLQLVQRSQSMPAVAACRCPKSDQYGRSMRAVEGAASAQGERRTGVQEACRRRPSAGTSLCSVCHKPRKTLTARVNVTPQTEMRIPRPSQCQRRLRKDARRYWDAARRGARTLWA